MGLVQCKHCGFYLASDAKTCPHCGGNNANVFELAYKMIMNLFQAGILLFFMYLLYKCAF